MHKTEIFFFYDICHTIVTYLIYDTRHNVNQKIKSRYIMNLFKKIISFPSNLKVFFWSTLWLMILLTIGTIEQKEIGLYQSQVKYFNSWFFKVGFIPLPGGLFTLGLIYFGLCSQLLLKTHFRQLKKLGITIAHLGSLLLLSGGIITNYSGIEGSMIIPEGETVNYFQDYHQFELVITPLEITDTEKTTNRALLTITQNEIASKKIYQVPTTGITLRIQHFFKNSEMLPRDILDIKNEVGFFSKFILKEKKMAADENENLPTFIFDIHGSLKDGAYAAFKDMPIAQTLTAKDGRRYKVEVRSLRHYLPFSISLHDFEKIIYPSSSIPKSFKSEITVHDAQVNQKVVIQMNEPLRYKGYTFYQSSFSENSDGEITDLAVVKNFGKYFPYFSSIIICIGLLIHLILNKSQFFKREKHDQ